MLVKHGQTYYYARWYEDFGGYMILTNVGEKEGRDIVEKANGASEFNKRVDKFHEDAIKFMDSWDGMRDGKVTDEPR